MSITWLIFATILLAAALFDVYRYIIPNALSVALVALFLIVSLMAGEPAAYWPHWAAGLVILAVGYGLYATTGMGAGDAKFAAAVGLWAGPAAMLPLSMAFAVAMALLAFSLIALRRIANRAGRAPTLRVLKIDAPVPLGIAISAAGLAASRYFNPAFWNL